MTTISSVSPFSPSDADVVADAILDASQPIHITPPHHIYEHHHHHQRQIQQNLATFTPSGLATPAKILHHSLSDCSTPMPSQQQKQQQQKQQHHLTPLAHSRPHNPNLSSAARPPLPHNGQNNTAPTTNISVIPSQHTSASKSRPPPLSQLYTPGKSISTPAPNYKPIINPANNTPIGCIDPSQIVATPSDLFGKFNTLSSLRTPVTVTKQAQNSNDNISGQATTPTGSGFSNRHVIPLSFSATNTPVARQVISATPSPRQTPPSNNEQSLNSSPLELDPNPAQLASFFRQRSAHLSSPIFCNGKSVSTVSTAVIPSSSSPNSANAFHVPHQHQQQTTSSPVVRANPLAQSDIAAAEIPPSVRPVHVADVDFSLVDAFSLDNAQPAINIDLGVRAARVPVPYAIRLRIIDRHGPIRPIEARLERLLEGPQSMFLSVIDHVSSSAVVTPVKIPNNDSEILSDDEMTQSQKSNEDEDDDIFHLFWAAPDTFTPNGFGRLLLSVTDSEYTDHEIPINITARPTKPSISVQAPGYGQREVRTETNVTFNDENHDSEVLISVFNETENDAPVLINVVLEDNASGAFTIGRQSSERVQCIPFLLHSGGCESFRARFSMRPDITVRRCYYGSVLIKYACVMTNQLPPGQDLELHQYYDHVLNLTASIPKSNDNETTMHSDATVNAARRVSLWKGTVWTGAWKANEDTVLSTSDAELIDTNEHDVYDDDQEPLDIQNEHSANDNTDDNDISNPEQWNASEEAVPSVSGAENIDNSEQILSENHHELHEIQNQHSAIDNTNSNNDNSKSDSRSSHPDANRDDTTQNSSDERTVKTQTVGRPKLKMPRRVRENGVVMSPSEGTVELPVLNATAELVEVSITVESTNSRKNRPREEQHNGEEEVPTTTVTPSYVVIAAGEQARLTMMRTSSQGAESLVVLRAATMGERPGRATYRVPAHIASSAMQMEPNPQFSVDRPTMSFYNPCSPATKEWAVRLRNGTSQATKYRVSIGEGCGTLYNSAGNPAFRITSPTEGIVQPERFITIRVAFDGNGEEGKEKYSREELVRHFHGKLNVRVGTQRDFMPLFGFTGASDIRLTATHLGYVVAKNFGNRYGFIVITGPEVDAASNNIVKAVLAPGEEREFTAPCGTGSVVYTGDEIARSRQRRAEELRRLDSGDSYEDVDDSSGLVGGDFDGEDVAQMREGLDWIAEDKFSMFYSGRLLDHNMKRYVFNLNDGDGLSFAETNRASQCGWTASVEDGFIHVENLEVEKEIQFQVEGAEPSYGVIAPLGDAMLAAFRESVEIRAQGRTETFNVVLPEIE